MKVELTSIPMGQYGRISGFVEGAKAMINTIDYSKHPYKIEVDFKKSGNCHIYLITGEWSESGKEIYYE